MQKEYIVQILRLLATIVKSNLFGHSKAYIFFPM